MLSEPQVAPAPAPTAAMLPAARWYAVQSQPRREALALLHLGRQGFAGFCPMRPVSRKRGRRRVSVAAPLFPGYLFVRLDLERDRWRAINGTIGVLRLVAFSSDGRPAPLPPGFVERLQQWRGGDGGTYAAAPLAAGERVRVIGGPFDDLCGVLETAGAAERVTILLALLGQETRVQVRRALLIAA